MGLDEEIEKEKTARKLEILRNDIIISTIFIILIIVSTFEFDKTKQTNFDITKSLILGLFYILFFSKLAANNFIFNLKNNKRFVLFSTRAIHVNGENYYGLHRFSIWWKKYATDTPIISKAKTISNLLSFPIILFLGIIIYYMFYLNQF
ncbi:MAG: hypothetical protein AB8F94_06640 [Saprospiraceae bacterium]